MSIAENEIEGGVRFVRRGDALILAAIVAMVLLALAAFWAIGTEAYLTWRTESPTSAAAPPDPSIAATGSPVT